MGFPVQTQEQGRLSQPFVPALFTRKHLLHTVIQSITSPAKYVEEQVTELLANCLTSSVEVLMEIELVSKT